MRLIFERLLRINWRYGRMWPALIHLSIRIT